MGKHVAKGKIANKLHAKKNKKLMKSGNLKELQTGKQIGAKFNQKSTPKAKANAQAKNQKIIMQKKVWILPKNRKFMIFSII